MTFHTKDDGVFTFTPDGKVKSSATGTTHTVASDGSFSTPNGDFLLKKDPHTIEEIFPDGTMVSHAKTSYLLLKLSPVCIAAVNEQGVQYYTWDH